jgi:hypothetical protein
MNRAKPKIGVFQRYGKTFRILILDPPIPIYLVSTDAAFVSVPASRSPTAAFLSGPLLPAMGIDGVHLVCQRSQQGIAVVRRKRSEMAILPLLWHKV